MRADSRKSSTATETAAAWEDACTAFDAAYQRLKVLGQLKSWDNFRMLEVANEFPRHFCQWRFREWRFREYRFSLAL
jgi:hypothetical protein